MRKSRILIFTLILAVVLTACGQNPQNDRQLPGETESRQSEGNNLHMLEIGTQAGRYGTAYQDDHTILCYLDYANACDTAFCTQPACNHDSDSCTAYIPDGVIVSALYAVDDQTMAYILTSKEGDQLYLADSNGANRRKLYQAASGEEFWELTCADSQYLYFPMTFTETDGSASQSFCRLPLSGGEPEPLIQELDSQILGAWGRDLVCYKYQYDEPENLQEPSVPEGATQEETDRIMMEYLDSFKGTHEVYLSNLDDGSRKELDGWDSTMGNEGRVQFCADDRLYWCETENRQLPDSIHWLLPDGQSGETALSWPEDLRLAIEGSTDWYSGAERLEGMLQDWVLITLKGPWDGMRRYAMNVTDGSVKEIPLRYQSNGKNQPITILGQSKDSLLVEIETQLKEVTFIQQDGTPSTNWAGVGRFGLITFEDFLSGTPEYREIDTQYLESIW